MSCENCYNIIHPACSDTLFIPAGLVSLVGQTVIVELTDKFGHIAIQEVEVDGDGNLFFELNDLPEGYLNEHFGPVIIKIQQNLTSTCYLPFTKTDCDSVETEYTCLKA